MIDKTRYSRIIGYQYSRVPKIERTSFDVPYQLPQQSTGYVFPDSYLYTELSVNVVDNYGNPVELNSRKAGLITNIWGYGGLYIVAKVENASAASVSAISGLVNIGTSPLVEALTPAQDQALRNLPNVRVTSYKYKPYVGVTEITDYSGKKTFYGYDADGRLITIGDDKNQLVKSYQYNIKQCARNVV